MFVVADVQGFRGRHGEFVLKEAAFIHDGEMTSFLFKPPYGWEELPPDIRRTNIFLKRRYHGLAWDYGDLAYSHVRATLRQHMHGIVFVKGVDKIRWLRELAGGDFHIVDLHQFGCPTLQRLRKPPCLSAQTNVIKLAEWLKMYICCEGLKSLTQTK